MPSREKIEPSEKPVELPVSLRDWFAGQAIGLIVVGSDVADGDERARLIAEDAYRMADALLRAREKE